MPKSTITPTAQPLSKVDDRVLPPTYLNHYERLKHRDPKAAQEFWDKWAFDPRPKAKDRNEPALKVLERSGRDDTLKRRV